MCVSVCVRACVRACVRVCVRVLTASLLEIGYNLKQLSKSQEFIRWK